MKFRDPETGEVFTDITEAAPAMPERRGVVAELQENRKRLLELNAMAWELRCIIAGAENKEDGERKAPECMEEEIAVQGAILQEARMTLGFVLERLSQ